MFISLATALLLLFSGSTFMQSMLNPDEHPARFILFWVICAWLTLTAILLAIFDLLMVRSAGRKAQKTVDETLAGPGISSSPRSAIDK
jgi:hypothetical protein